MKQLLFDDFRLQPENHVLLRGDAPVPLPPKAFDTLVYLAENHGRLVTRDELMRAVWPDSFVEGANLTVYISLLRKALGEEGGRRYIETVPRKGYRLTAEIQIADDAAPRQAAPPSTDMARRRRLRWWAALAIPLTGAALWLGTARPPAPRQMQRTRLTSFGPELAITAAAISPDGKAAAYANAGGIFVQQIDSGESHALAMPGPSFHVLSISWFPDGTKLLVGGFALEADAPELWTVQVMGESAPARLGEGVAATVSPDGSRIAISGGPRWSPPESSATAGPEIRLMRADGEGLHTIVTGQTGENFGRMAWTDSGRLVWVHYRWDPQQRGNTGSLETYDVESGKRSVVLSGSGFSGDVVSTGGKLVYAQLLGSNPSSKYGGRLFAVDGNSRPTPLADWAEPIAGLSAPARGRGLLVRNAVMQHSVFVADLPGFDVVRRLTFGLGREDFARAWTPDSQAVVFDSNRNGTWELFRQKLNAPMDEPLVHSADDAFSPRLSPDGRWFLYMDRPKSWRRGEPVKVVRVPVGGGPAQVVLEAAGISDWGLRFECSAIAGGTCVLAQRQGKQIAFRRFDVLRGLEAGEALRADTDGVHPLAWTVSPDGSKLAWAHWDAIEGRIEVSPLGTARGSAMEVVSGCSHIHSLRWAMGGKGWFVTSEWPVNWRISYVADNGSARVLARGTGMHAPDVVPSPDGRRVAFSERITESNLWLLDGF